MSYEIITQHMNGTIQAQNTNTGAKFIIKIPYHTQV
jgi:signal transduction histidine kinase